MSKALTVQGAVVEAPEPPNLRMVALTPGDVGKAQADLAAWCDKKIASLRAESDELDEALKIALKNRWRRSTYEKCLNLTAKWIMYYEKIKAASLEGHLIVPNFDVEVMAVRVSRVKPRFLIEGHQGDRVNLVRPELLPVGEGRYVDDVNVVEHRTHTVPDGKGGTREIHRYSPVEFDDEVDFPVIGVKPIILEATALAMSKKIFDRIGVVTGKKTDPVVVGQIIDPRGSITRWHQPTKFVSFFIAWWLDTDML